MGDLTINKKYWNHNVAYHDWILKLVGTGNESILDVGCGEGLLLEKLLPCIKKIVGIDPDEYAIVPR
jgi:2-polyprenyl-3-methyl-5-hydroxy-6-metoxy-1,4-benzoquinol methylase